MKENQKPRKWRLNVIGIPSSEDPFFISQERIAAEARQLFRALEAKDSMALELCWFHFQDYLLMTLMQHLRQDPNWDSGRWWLDGLAGAPVDVRSPCWLRLRDEVYPQLYEHENQNVSTSQPEGQFHCSNREPFEFELELFPLTGAFRRYTFHFGDEGHLTKKKLTSTMEYPKEEGWAFTFFRRCFEDIGKSKALRTEVPMQGESFKCKGLFFNNSEDHFANDEEWIAALARQFFRALEVKDSKAEEVCLLYLRHQLLLTLRKCLYQDFRWDSGGKYNPMREVIRFKGAPMEAKIPIWLRTRDEVIWAWRSMPVFDTEGRETRIRTVGPSPDLWFQEPFEFELELCPMTGSFRSFSLHFGDSQNLSDKLLTSPLATSVQGQGDTGWAFSFYRQRY